MAEKPPTEAGPDRETRGASEREPQTDDDLLIVRRDDVDHQSAASFPASDPPGWWAGR